jgi:hypothetical protein
MPNAVFNYNVHINGRHAARIKGLGAEVSALIEESVQNGGKESMIPKLYLERKSDQQTETVAIEDSLGYMEPTVDGDHAKTDKTNQIGEKSISHVIYTKDVIVTKVMMEDAHYSMKPSIEIKARSLPDSYFSTRELIAQNAYINAEKASWKFGKAKINLTTYDGKPLFATNHEYGDEEVGHAFGTQSNLFYVSGIEKNNAGQLAELLAQGDAIIHQMKNANGVAQGFHADTVFVPSSVSATGLRHGLQRAVGSEYFPGGSNNDINTQYNQWSINPLTYWDPKEDEIIIMSQKAKDQMKAMFFNRITLDINVYSDPGTENMHWFARTRFGVGFIDYKHCIRIKINPASTDGLTEIKL